MQQPVGGCGSAGPGVDLLALATLSIKSFRSALSRATSALRRRISSRPLLSLEPIAFQRTSAQVGDAANADRINPTWEYACGKLPHIVRVLVSMSSDSNPSGDIAA